VEHSEICERCSKYILWHAVEASGGSHEWIAPGNRQGGVGLNKEISGFAIDG